MKSKWLVLTALVILTSGMPAFAEEKKEAKPGAANVEAGPRKGRMLGDTGGEFFVEKDGTVSVIFYDKDKKVIAPSDESVNVIATKDGKQTKLVLEPKGNSLVSKSKLPEGEGFPIAVQVKKGEGKPRNFRFTLELYTCKECSNPEYACTCADH
ncbi:MAG: hypothetical protein ACR2OZ_14910 [Verrucomicrobiales bacterium]